MADDENICLEDVSPVNTPFPSNLTDDSNLFEDSFKKEIENVTTGSTNIKADGENTDNVCDGKISLNTFALQLETAAEDKVPNDSAEVDLYEKQGEEKCCLLSDQDTSTSFKNEQVKKPLTKNAYPSSVVAVSADNIELCVDETNERELNFTKKVRFVVEDKNEFSSEGTEFRHRHFLTSELEFNCESNTNCPSVIPAEFVTSDLQTEKPFVTNIASADSGRVESKKNGGGSTKVTTEREFIHLFSKS